MTFEIKKVSLITAMKVFVVCPDEDCQEIDTIEEDLGKSGFDCITKRLFTPGRPEPINIYETVQKCDRMLLALTNKTAEKVTLQIIKELEKSMESKMLALRILVMETAEVTRTGQELEGLLGCIYHCDKQRIHWKGKEDTEQLIRCLRGK